MTSHPPVLSLLFLDKCVTGAVQTAPVTMLPFAPAHEGSYGWHARGTIPQTTASVRSAASGDCSRMVEARSGACLFIKEKQQQRIRIHAHASHSAGTAPTAWARSKMHCGEGVSMAQLSMPTSFTVSPLSWGSPLRDAVASSFAWNWNHTKRPNTQRAPSR